MNNTAELKILITGATDGLGQLVAAHLAEQGATLLLHGRDQRKGERLLEDIREKTGNSALHYYNADLASLEEVRRLADEIGNDHQRLDILINNAGLGAGPDTAKRETSADGYELRLAVNYLAPFLLTRRLLPLLRSAAEISGEARIVNVSSAAQQAIDFDDVMLEGQYDGMRAYAQSKLALIMFTFDMAEELAGSGVTANALHPASLMDTRMVREWFGTPRTSVEEGAEALEYVALADELDGVTGEYFNQKNRARAKSQAYDAQARRRLRALSEKWIGEK